MSKSETQILNFDVLKQASPVTQPFWYMVTEGVIPADKLNEINTDYPAIDTPANFDPRDLDYGPAFEKVLEDLDSDAFERLIEEKFDIKLSNASKTITVRRYSEMSDGNIHTDHWSKVMTVLLYFNESWDQEGGKLRLLRNNQDIEDYLAEVTPAYGTLLAFKRSDTSYHGYKRFKGERRMVQVNWVKSGPLARLAQRIARWGTHTGKRFLRFFQKS